MKTLYQVFENAVERCFHRCNLIGEDVDIYREMNRYKILRESSPEVRDTVYEYLAYRLGFML